MAYKIKLYDTEYDCIGVGCMSLDFINFQLQMAVGDVVEVDISSGGGSHFDAVAMYHELKKYGNVNTNNISIAGSAASTVFAAGKKRTMSKYALLMIHPAQIVTAGDAKMLISDADCINKCTENVKQIWVDVTGQSYDVISEMVDSTTWLNAETALQLGFITDIEDYIIEEPVLNANVILNQIISAPASYKQVINKILIKQPEPAQIENTMTAEEKQALLDKNESFFKKVLNFFRPSIIKVVTNKGDKYVLNSLAEGSPVFNDADMDTPAADEDDIEATNAAGKKVKMSVKNGKVAKAELDEEDADKADEDEEDPDFEPDNKVVLNTAGINFKKVVGNKVIKNAMALKLKEVTNASVAKDVLITELKEQLKVSNEAVKLTEEEIRAKIKSTFQPTNSSRSNTLAITDDGNREFIQPKTDLAKNAAKLAFEKNKK